jgi:hypothetical protein
MITNIDCAMDDAGQIIFCGPAPRFPHALLTTYDGENETGCYLDVAGATALRDALNAYLDAVGEGTET